MKGFPSVRDPGTIERLLTEVGNTTPPVRADREFLVALGLRREADSALLEMLGFLGFVGADGIPTGLWDGTSGDGSLPVRLGRAVRTAYSGLFETLPDAPGTDGAVLMDFFRRATGAADPDLAYMVLTFKVLCDLAELPKGEPPVPTPPPPSVPEAVPEAPRPAVPAPVATEPPAPAAEPVPAEPPAPPACREIPVIRLSIHIDVSGETDPEIRDLAQRLLKRHLDAGGK